MPTFEEILQASKFIFKISKNARAMSESVLLQRGNNRYNWQQEVWKKIVNKSPLLTEMSSAKVCRQNIEKKTQILTNNFL